MADFIKGLFGGAKTSAQAPAKVDDDFADFAEYASAAPPSPPSHAASSPAEQNPFPASPTGIAPHPYTKWYRVWERTQPSDFYQEMFILPVIILFVVIHLWGTRANKRRARNWIAVHGPILREEYASVGFGGKESLIALEDLDGQSSSSLEVTDPDALLTEKAANEYTSYATGRQNVAFVDIKLTFVKRYNPLIRAGELLLSFFFDSVPAPEEHAEATAYSFANKEPENVLSNSTTPVKPGKSDYDGFVWAIVHKDLLKRLKSDRYDLSLTTQRDHPKLPFWATTLNESAEITDTILTPELVQAVEQAGEALEALIISDQPMDKPRTLDETEPKKRVSLTLRLPSGSDPAEHEPTLPLFRYFLRMTDQLVKEAHFRPEVLRRVKQTREDEQRKIRKVDEDEKREQHKTAEGKRKKEERDKKLKNMSADEQRKFLEKEKEKETRKAQKKRTMRA